MLSKKDKAAAIEKKCSRCKEIKSLSEYLPCKTGKFGLYNYCTDCHKQYQLNRNPNRKEIDEKEAKRVGLRKLGLKTCTSCRVVKSLDEFYEDPRHGDGKQSHCTECFLHNLDKQYLKREYGLTYEQVVQIIDFQKGLCAICGRPPKKNRFNIDHCHTTHRIRAMLCVNCNTNLLPFVELYPEWITKAFEYLKNPPAFGIVGEIIVPETNQARTRERKKELAKIKEKGLVG